MLKNWNSTNVLNAIVPADGGGAGLGAVAGAHSSTASVPSAITAAEMPTAVQRLRVRIRSVQRARACAHHVAVGGVDAEGHGRRAVHDDVHPQDGDGGERLAAGDAEERRRAGTAAAKPSVVLSWKRTNLTMLA